MFGIWTNLLDLDQLAFLVVIYEQSFVSFKRNGYNNFQTMMILIWKFKWERFETIHILHVGVHCPFERLIFDIV